MKNFEAENYLSEKIIPSKVKDFKPHKDFVENKSILGIDIYKYSKYPFDSQVYIPVLFNRLYEFTVEACSVSEKFVFQKYGKTKTWFKKHFISTGDGGFQVFNNPLECLVFAAYFQLNLRCYNTGNFPFPIFQNLFSLTGPIELRYCITTDDLYKYSNNFYGPGIINNARILAKDSLNRLLIDSNSVKWFDNEINTVENLLVMEKENFMKTSYFMKYNKTFKSNMFDKPGTNKQVKSLDILKIDTIKSKDTILDIYNLHMQVGLYAKKLVKHDYRYFLVSLGNMNTSGIQ